MTAPPPLAAVTDLAVEYRRDGHRVSALAQIGLRLAAAERLAVIGESGSGKSTFAMALAGLLPPEARLGGRIDWPSGRLIAGRDIGVVFQDPGGSFDPVQTIGSHLLEVIGVHRALPGREARALALDLVARVRLPDPPAILRAYPHQLSGGQRQRAALAIAIAAGPRLLIADEPTSALDTVVQAEIIDLIRDLVAETRMALVFVTHDVALAGGLADRIAVFYAGRMVELGTADEVLSAPRHPYTRALIASHIGLEAVPGRPLATIAGTPPDPADAPGGCRFAPRCPRADADCAVEPPRHGARHAVACHHPHEPGGPA